MAAELLGGAVVGALVNTLLTEVQTRAKHLISKGKNFALLCECLDTLQPLVNSISRSVIEPDDPAYPCLQGLYKHLNRADELVKECNTLRKRDFLKTIPVSKKLVDVTEDIRKCLTMVPVGGWATSLQMVQVTKKHSQAVEEMMDQLTEKLSQTVEEMRREFELMRLGEPTKKILNTPKTKKNFGISFATMTPSLAAEKIRILADPNYNSQGGTHGEATSSSSAAQEPESTIRVRDVQVGGDDLVKRAKRLLLSELHGESSKWVAIWSMGGAGKTFTAGRVYDDDEIQNRFVGGTFWLTVGRERSTLSMLQQLSHEILKRDIRSEEEAKAQLKSELANRKHALLVLDDVWQSTDLASLDIIGEYSSGNRILVTTRQKDLLDKVFAEKLEIPMLSPKHSWELFCWHAFHGEAKVSPHLQNDARKVADECKGLPLALKVIGGTMAGKNDKMEWKLALQKLRNADIISTEHEQQLFHRLELSLEDLPGIHKRLLDCFYYFAAFPEDEKVNVSELLSCWVGEGMVESVNAYGLLGFLVARSLIELDSWRESELEFKPRANSLTCKMHDVLRDLARNILKKKGKVHEMECLYQPGLELRCFPTEWMPSHGQTSIAGSSLSVQRLSLMHNNLDELPAEPLMAPNLRVLLLGYNPQLQSPPRTFFSRLSHLRVLVMQKTGIAEIPSEAFKNLKSLQLLDLSYCKNLKKISSSIKHLKNLRELSLLFCPALKTLPSEISNLKSLETFKSLGTLLWDTKEKGRLSSHLGWSASATLQTVSTWKELKDLSLMSFQPLTSFPINFDALKLLTSLNLYVTELPFLSFGSSLAGLEYLRLRSMKVTSLSGEFTALSGLQELNLSSCVALSSLPALDELPELELLILKGCTGLKSIPDSFGHPGAFPSLLTLDMGDVGRGECTFPTLQQGAMRLLTDLRINGWYELTELPKGLQFLGELRSLDLRSCTKLESLEPVFVPGSFPHLQGLVLTDTWKLDRLPKSLETNTELVTLHLVKCPARAFLPAELQSREGLRILC